MRTVKQRRDGVVQRYNEAPQIRFHYDAGHGWLEVPLSELKRSGVAGKISPYSYLRGQIAYLEEDRDAGLYLDAVGKAASQFEDVDDGNHSRIRGYPRFPSPENWDDNPPEKHPDKWEVLAAWGDWQKGVPKGHHGLFVGKGGRLPNGDYPSQTRYLIVPENLFKNNGSYSGTWLSDEEVSKYQSSDFTRGEE